MFAHRCDPHQAVADTYYRLTVHCRLRRHSVGPALQVLPPESSRHLGRDHAENAITNSDLLARPHSTAVGAAGPFLPVFETRPNPSTLSAGPPAPGDNPHSCIS